MELRLPTTHKLSLDGSSGRFTALGADSQVCQGKDFDLPSSSGQDTASRQPVGNPNRCLDARSRQFCDRGAGLRYHSSELFMEVEQQMGNSDRGFQPKRSHLMGLAEFVTGVC